MLKVVWNIIKKFFSVIFYVLSPLKRLVCRRKRRVSDTILPLANHYPSVENLLSAPNGTSQVPEFDSWDTSWDTDNAASFNQQTQNTSANQQARNYGSHLHQQQQQKQEEEPEPDYFEDMTPVVKKPKKLYIRKKEDVNTSAISSKLAVASDVPLMQSSELQAWEDSQTWEDEAVEDLSWEAEAALKETRKAERMQRQAEQQRKKMEREASRNMKRDSQFSAVKLS